MRCDSEVRAFRVQPLRSPLRTVCLRARQRDVQAAWMEGPTFCVEAVHHASDELNLILQGEVDEVRVNEDAIGWREGLVVREKERGSDWCTTMVRVSTQKNVAQE